MLHLMRSSVVLVDVCVCMCMCVCVYVCMCVCVYMCICVCSLRVVFFSSHRYIHNSFLNMAMRHFDSSVVNPTVFVLFTVFSIAGSLILYKEFQGMSVLDISLFVLGYALAGAVVLWCCTVCLYGCMVGIHGYLVIDSSVRLAVVLYICVCARYLCSCMYTFAGVYLITGDRPPAQTQRTSFDRGTYTMDAHCLDV